MWCSIRLALTAAVAVAPSILALPQQPETTPTASTNSSGKACNNSPSLCSRKYNAITHAGVHDSAFLRDASTDNSNAGNQFLNATDALSAGFRLLQAQLHEKDGTQELCHTTCNLLDAGSLKEWLSHIADWMKDNTNDVVTLLLVNSDSADAPTFASLYKDVGLDKYAYTPKTPGRTSDWPTLQEMIDQNQRLVTFVTDLKADTSAPYILPEFTYVFETPYQVTTADGFNCTLDRPSGKDAATALQDNFMSLANHFKYDDLALGIMVPDVTLIDVTNGAGTANSTYLGSHLDTCKSQWGKVPNFFLIDFWNKANPLDAADKMNNLNDISGRTKVDDTSDDSDNESTGSGRDHNLMHGALVAFMVAAMLLL